jgi:hypothetical protein
MRQIGYSYLPFLDKGNFHGKQNIGSLNHDFAKDGVTVLRRAQGKFVRTCIHLEDFIGIAGQIAVDIYRPPSWVANYYELHTTYSFQVDWSYAEIQTLGSTFINVLRNRVLKI